MGKKVLILSGVPGSGKSTLRNKVLERYPVREAGYVNTDQFFERAVQDLTKPSDRWEVEFKFDGSKLPEAHGWCMRKFVAAATTSCSGTDLIIVDNTNTTVAEIAPYAAVGQAFMWDVAVFTVSCMADVAHARNVHGLGLETVKRMAENIGSRQLPPWWKQFSSVAELEAWLGFEKGVLCSTESVW